MQGQSPSIQPLADFVIDHKVLGFPAPISLCVATFAPLWEAEIANRLFLGSLAGCSARRFERRLASRTSEEQRRNAPVNVASLAAKNGVLVISASLDTVAAIHKCGGVDRKVVFSGQPCAPGQITVAAPMEGSTLLTIPGSNTLALKNDIPSLGGKVTENARPANGRAACLKPRDPIHHWLENGIGNLPQKECKATVSRAESHCGEPARAEAQAKDKRDEVAQAFIHKAQVEDSCQASRNELTPFRREASLGAANDTQNDTPNNTSNDTQERQLAAFEAAVAHGRP